MRNDEYLTGIFRQLGLNFLTCQSFGASDQLQISIEVSEKFDGKTQYKNSLGF